ncbi:hypothetical protein J437_LFUL003732 [Ladona fulva]|uniref:Uncharacterized protein n=1 Tax=Ladona fulva TaxID=123851 RepID=A0A8K0NTC2_LADFU|nr:hypothetical protein J437_LFUL003732 [Ladona fulva]
MTQRHNGSSKMMTRGRRKIFMIFCAFVIVLIILVVIIWFGMNYDEDEDPSSPLPPSPSPLGRYKKAAVATNGAPCAQIGKDILLKNGSAVDAAIAALFCEGVTCLQSMGLGGGFFMTIYDRKNRKAISLDARETAPAGATEDMYHGNANLSQYGGLSVAVPGELRGYWEAYKRFGRLPWKDLVMPSVELCQKGSPVNAYTARLLRYKEEKIKESPTMSEILINPETGKTWEEGQVIKRLALAETLKVIAEEGGDALYNGSLVKSFVDDIRNLGGIITQEDMANYRVNWDEPIHTDLMNGKLTVYSGPPPGSGVLLMKNLTSKEYAVGIRKELSDMKTWQEPEHYGAVLSQPEDHGTAHISIVSPDGDAVSVTSTINLLLGAVARSQSTGIILNDEMDDFSAPNITNAFGIPPSPANFIKPGKRPFSSMCPLIFVNNETGDVRLVIGAAGGSKITTAATLVSIFNLWFNQTIKEAIDSSRIHHQLFPMHLQYEHGFLKQNVEGLRNIGHKMEKLKSAGSTLTAVAYDGKELTANSDYRRLGRIAGF